MISDDERREVARRLRQAWANVPDKNPVRHHMRVLYEIYAAVGLNDDGVDAIDLFDRLADLIDPTCLARADVEDTPDGGQFDCWSCSVCGNILSSDPDYDTETDGPAYCEACGHRIVGKGEPTWL